MSNASKYRKKAVEYEQLKQFDRAVASYVRAIEENENAGEDIDVALFNKVGDLTLRQGRVTEAVTYYERAVEHYANGGLFDNAIALCNKILRNTPGRSAVYFTLGRICARKGLRSDATRNFLEYATRMQGEGRVDEGMRALAEVADLMPELVEVRKLVEEHAERAGIQLPQRRTPTPAKPAAAATVNAAGQSFGLSKDLVFLDIDYDAPAIAAAVEPLEMLTPSTHVVPELTDILPLEIDVHATTSVLESTESVGRDASPSRSDAYVPTPVGLMSAVDEVVESHDGIAGHAVLDTSEQLGVVANDEIVGGEPLGTVVAETASDPHAMVEPTLVDDPFIAIVAHDAAVTEIAAADVAHTPSPAPTVTIAPATVTIAPATVTSRSATPAVVAPVRPLEAVLMQEVAASSKIVHDDIAHDDIAHNDIAPDDVASDDMVSDAAVPPAPSVDLDFVALPTPDDEQVSLEPAAMHERADEPLASTQHATPRRVPDALFVDDEFDTDVTIAEDPIDGFTPEESLHSPVAYAAIDDDETTEPEPTPTSVDVAVIDFDAMIDAPETVTHMDDIEFEEFEPVNDDLAAHRFVRLAGDLQPPRADAFDSPDELPPLIFPMPFDAYPLSDASAGARVAERANANGNNDELFSEPTDELFDPFVASGMDSAQEPEPYGHSYEASIDSAFDNALDVPFELDPDAPTFEPPVTPEFGAAANAFGSEGFTDETFIGHELGSDAFDDDGLDASYDTTYDATRDAPYDSKYDAAFEASPDARIDLPLDDLLGHSVVSAEQTIDTPVELPFIVSAELPFIVTDDGFGDQTPNDTAADTPTEVLTDVLTDVVIDVPIDTPPGDVASIDDFFADAELSTAAAAAEASALAAARRDELRALVHASPRDSALRRRLAESMFETGERDAGIAELARALFGYEHDGNLLEAANISDTLVQVAGDQVRHHQKRVELAVRLGDQTRLREAYLDLADNLVRNGDELRSRAVYARVLEIDPWDDRARAALGDSAPPAPPRPEPVSDDGDVDLASWLRDDDEPQSTRLRMREPEISGNEQDDFNSLLRHFKEGVARSIGDDDHDSHYDLGVAYKEMGLLDDAIGEFQMALRSKHNRLAAYEALGQCFLEQQSYKVAVTVLSRALHEPGIRDEQLVGVLYLLGYSCEALQRFDEARSYFERVYATDILFRDVAQRLADLDRITR